MEKRFWEIDAIRGFTIINMVLFNYVFVLNFLGVIGFEFGISYAILIAGTFIFLSGISQTLGRNMKNYGFKKFLKRGIELLAWGLAITLATFAMFPDYFIMFGILQFMGMSVILGQFFHKFKEINLVLGLVIFVSGFYLMSFSVNFPWLLWLGIPPEGFQTFDYFPIFPWFGLTLWGIYAGNEYYAKGKRSFKIPDVSKNPFVKVMSFLGRNSLKIYLLHQPVLAVFILILGLV
ncbi:MAG: DUF1624 domain-containing protein [Candidatus Aenigmarchaeota archaeon]|nr:DUF1624 domain-containing protein [Candidatus Aenigmarchaeota archaeon]